MGKYRVTVHFVAEETKATHYFSVSEISFEFFGSTYSAEAVYSELFRYLAIQYPDRTIQNVYLHARN
jgi:hypothetical protein